MASIKSSSGDNKHPYTKLSFWEEMLNDPKKAFYENDRYTEKGKEMMRESIRNMRQGERRLTNLGKAA